MRQAFLVWVCLLVFLVPVHAAEKGTFEYGDRPPSSLYDPERSLSSELADRLIQELEKANHLDHADVIVVLLPTVGELPPEHVARRFSEAWGDRLLHAVILDVTGRNDGPWIFIGGEIASSDRYGYIPQKVREILRLARQEPDREASVRAATLQTSDMLRFLKGRVRSQGEAYLTEQIKMRLEAEDRERRRKIILYGGLASLAPFTGIVVLIVLFFLRRRPRRFPSILWSRRLGAPHAGGNDAVVDLGRSSHS